MLAKGVVGRIYLEPITCGTILALSAKFSVDIPPGSKCDAELAMRSLAEVRISQMTNTDVFGRGRGD